MMSILGTGVVFARGRGPAALEKSLREGWAPPAWEEIAMLPDRRIPLYLVPPDALGDRALPSQMRRADRFCRMAVATAQEAAGDRLAVVSDRSRIGIVLATAWGPHVTTFRFLDDILDYGDAGGSPTTFSHSVHNAVASYIAAVMNIRGPAVTLTGFSFPFHQALILAEAWLAERRCDCVLAGAVEEIGPTLKYILARELTLAPDGKIRPFAFQPKPNAVPGEGSVFFLLGPAGSGNDAGACRITAAPGAADASSESGRPDVQLVEADGLARDESAYPAAVPAGIPAAAYAPLWGSMTIGSAFHCAAGALMIRDRTIYPFPVPDNPSGIALAAPGNNAALRRLSSLRCDGRGATARIWMERGT